MIRKGLAIAAVAALGLSAQPASAAMWCGSTVSASWVNYNGDVLILGSWRGTHTQICNLKTEWKGISPDICASWMAKMDAAVSLGRAVTVYYAETMECSALPTYGDSPAPYYVMLQ